MPNRSTGISGTIGVLDALIQRAEKGGSYCVDVSEKPISSFPLSSVILFRYSVLTMAISLDGIELLFPVAGALL